MRLLIDNLDGHGAVDYSVAMCAEGPGVITRPLNGPSSFRVSLLLSGSSLIAPLRRARVVVSTDDGTVLFTGYLPTEPEEIRLGAGMSGADGALAVVAASDEWLLDQQGASAVGAAFGQGGDALLQMLTERTDPQRFSVSAAGTIRPLGLFVPERNEVWSQQAAAIARGALAAYRVLGGAVSLLPLGSVTHVVPDDGEGPTESALRLRCAKALVNDITISGEREPGSYVTEVFQGDGTTAEFVLSAVPFRPSGRSGTPAFAENFAAAGAALDAEVWTVADSGSHLQLGAAGLLLGGGTGLDGQTTLTWQNAIELGGTITLEVAGVLLNQGSDGVLCGVYGGSVRRDTCLAGFDVRQSGGATVVRAIVGGAGVGGTTTLRSAHVYTLRLRLHCAEMYRVPQVFSTMVGGAVQSFGASTLPADVHAVLEIVDLGLSSNTPATVLFDGVISPAAAVASFAPVNSVQLLGSLSSVQIVQGGPLLVTSTSSAGVSSTRRLGVAGEGADAEISGDRLTFFPGRLPSPGEALTVKYRTTQRAVARVQDATSVLAEARNGLPGDAQLLVHALEPPARTSEDCAAAARGLLSASTSRTAALEGEYTAEGTGDLWPGDLLQVEYAGQVVWVLVRSVEVRDEQSLPEVLRYRATLANDWAEPFAIRVTPGVAADVTLPTPVLPGSAGSPASLAGMSVVQVSGAVIQMDMGEAAPTGGGFEVRRRDGGFGPGNDPDLVVRSPVRGFSIPRTAQQERLFVRAYDGSAVPIYSAVSSAVYTHVPLSQGTS